MPLMSATNVSYYLQVSDSTMEFCFEKNKIYCFSNYGDENKVFCFIGQK